MTTAAVVNLTSVARMLHSSTPNARMKLDRAGLVPVSEIKMPESGRTYVLYRKSEALKFVEKVQREKNPPVKMNPKPAPAAAAPTASDERLEKLEQMLTMLLEHATKPQAKAPKARKAPQKRSPKADKPSTEAASA